MRNGRSLTEQYLHLMNERPDEDIPGTSEWQAKIFRFADERQEAYRSREKRIRNIGVGAAAVSLALFGADQLIDFMPQAVGIVEASVVGGTGLGAAIGAQLNLKRT